ncbi:MAG TPA: hypothetical protein VH436_21000 [Vicinamibacterales bacterium]|jgi:hypothetical protein
MRSCLSIVAIVLAGSTLAAQETVSVQDFKRQLDEREQAVKLYAFKERVALERTVKNAPYSAEVVIESNQSLADGNHISQRSTGRVYRDSEGRVRREEDRPNGTVAISIVDPVAGVSYSLDPDNRIAWKTPTATAEAIMKKVEAARKLEEERQRSGNTDANKAAEDMILRKREAERAAATVATGRVLERSGTAMEEHNEGALERKTLEGVAVSGRRNTTIIKAGAIGNDLPITITSEEWRSPDLDVLVMTRRSDPRSGDSSYRLTNIVRAEPDRSLFQVPADYTVKETGIRRNLEQ